MSSEEERLLLEASLETFSKHGIEQLKGAFNYAKDGDYSGFLETQEMNLLYLYNQMSLKML